MKICTQAKEEEEIFRVYLDQSDVILEYENGSSQDQWCLSAKEAYQLAIALRDSSLTILQNDKELYQESDKEESHILKSLVEFLKEVEKEIKK